MKIEFGLFLEPKSVLLRRLSRVSRRKQERQLEVEFEAGWPRAWDTISDDGFLELVKLPGGNASHYNTIKLEKD